MTSTSPYSPRRNRTRFAIAFSALALIGSAGVAAAALEVAGTAHAGETPAGFAVRIVELIGSNRYDEAWRSLHPVHQRIAPRAEYVGCESQSPIPGHVAGVRVLRVYDGPAALAPGRFVASKAVVVRITIAGNLGRVVVTDTVHAVPVGKRWAWVLPVSRLEEYRAGHCPDGSPS